MKQENIKSFRGLNAKESTVTRKYAGSTTGKPYKGYDFWSSGVFFASMEKTPWGWDVKLARNTSVQSFQYFKSAVSYINTLLSNEEKIKPFID